MSHIFIGGIPVSGKSYLAKKISEKIGVYHFDVDKLRKEMARDPKLKYWINFFWNQDEEEYLRKTSCQEHWQNLVNQSEAFWPTVLKKIEGIKKSHKSAIIEGVNILPHLAAKNLDFPGVYLLGESFDQIFERNRQNPRWGKSEKLQKMEAELFYNCERQKYKEEAEKYNYKVFEKSDDAEQWILKLA